jgi:hypothetical protein
MNLIDKADMYADIAHKAVGQKRKYTGVEYIEHPRRVANIVAKYGNDEMIAAALLHDVLEDTKVTSKHLRKVFGEKVTELVEELTDASKPEDGNRAKRKAIDAEKISKVSEEAQIIKLADLIDNSNDIKRNDPNFAKIFLEEKEKLLEIMTKVHDHPLFSEAKGIRLFEKDGVEFEVEMEDGRFELVASVFWSKNPKDFRIHRWGSPWLVASLTDDVMLYDGWTSIDGKALAISMGDLRRKSHFITTVQKTGGELRRPRRHKGAIVNKEAKPFTHDGK